MCDVKLQLSKSELFPSGGDVLVFVTGRFRSPHDTCLNGEDTPCAARPPPPSNRHTLVKWTILCIFLTG